MTRFGWLLIVLMLQAGPAAAGSGSAVTVQRVLSPGGIEAWLVEDHSNPLLSVQFSFAGGTALDPNGKGGLAAMVADLLDEGAGDLDSQTFHAKVEDLAATLSFTAVEDELTGKFQAVTANRAAAFDLLRLALSQPRIDKGPLEQVRGQLRTQLAQEQQDPSSLAWLSIVKLVYAGHPYGRDGLGTAESLASITDGDIKAWVTARLALDRMTIGVAGDITPAELGPLLDQVFGGLPAQAVPVVVPEAVFRGAGQVEVIRQPIPQSVAVFVEPGLKRDDADWYAATVMNNILGAGGFSSRLMDEVREKRGLAYGASSFLEPYRHAALIGGEVATRNDKMVESLAVIRQEWQRMARSGATPREIAETKAYLNGSFPLQMDSTAAIAGLLDVIQRDHLGIDYFNRRADLIDAVTQDDVGRVARRLLDADRLAIVVVGDPQGLKSTPALP